jgi:DNA primase
MLFVDYNQNARDHTIASAYSVRGVPEATVSTPISWDEIDEVDPRQFTIATVPARFAELGDLHQGIDDSAYSLDVLLEWAERDGLDQQAGSLGCDGRADDECSGRSDGPQAAH